MRSPPGPPSSCDSHVCGTKCDQALLQAHLELIVQSDFNCKGKKYTDHTRKRTRKTGKKAGSSDDRSLPHKELEDPTLFSQNSPSDDKVMNGAWIDTISELQAGFSDSQPPAEVWEDPTLSSQMSPYNNGMDNACFDPVLNQ